MLVTYESQQLVEDDLLFKDGGEPGEELGLEHDGGSGNRRSGHKHPRAAAGYRHLHYALMAAKRLSIKQRPLC